MLERVLKRIFQIIETIKRKLQKIDEIKNIKHNHVKNRNSNCNSLSNNIEINNLYKFEETKNKNPNHIKINHKKKEQELVFKEIFDGFGFVVNYFK